MFRMLAACVALAFAGPAAAEEKPNSLTPKKETADGWILLFDGESTFGWVALPRTTEDAPLPPKVGDGALVVSGADKSAAFVVQSMPFEDYELSYELKRNGPSKASVGIEVLHRTENGETGMSIGGRVVDAIQCPKPGEWYRVSIKANAGPNNTYSYVYAERRRSRLPRGPTRK